MRAHVGNFCDASPGGPPGSLQCSPCNRSHAKHVSLSMKSPFTLLNVDRLQSKVDVAARFHRLGMVLFVVACVCVTMPKGMGLPAWVPLAGFSATLLGFIIKGAGTLYEI